MQKAISAIAEETCASHKQLGLFLLTALCIHSAVSVYYLFHSASAEKLPPVMKRTPYDVFSLITPLSRPAPLPPAVIPAPPATLPTPEPKTTGQRLAAAMRRNRYVLPQVVLLDKQMTQGPSLVRYLQVGQLEAPDYAVRTVLHELDPTAFQAIRTYLWASSEYRQEGERWIELDPPLSFEAEAAFEHVYAALNASGMFRPRTRTRPDAKDSL